MKKTQALVSLILSLIADTVSAAMSLSSTDIRPGLAIPAPQN
jgi:hypothetical protein